MQSVVYGSRTTNNQDEVVLTFAKGNVLRCGAKSLELCHIGSFATQLRPLKNLIPQPFANKLFLTSAARKHPSGANTCHPFCQLTS